MKLLIFACVWLAAWFLPKEAWSEQWMLALLQCGIAVLASQLTRLRSSTRGNPWGAFFIYMAFAGLAITTRGLRSIDHYRPVGLVAFVTLVAAALSLRAVCNAGRKNVHVTDFKIFRLAASELRALRFAVAPPRSDVARDSGALAFFPAADVSQLAWAFVVLAAMESALLHLVAVKMHGSWLIGVAILSDVLIVYSVGIARSIRRMATVVRAETVHVRVGILFDFSFLKSDIATVQSSMDEVDRKGSLNGAFLSGSNVVILFKEPVRVSILSLFSRTVHSVRLKLESPSDFIRALGYSARTSAAVEDRRHVAA